MKKYTVFNKDLSQLVAEADAYLAGISYPGYNAQLYHKTGLLENLVGSIPSLASSFTDESLTPLGLAHWSIDTVERAIVAPCPILIVPLKNTENCTFNVAELKPNAQAYTDFITDNNFYYAVDCNVSETITISSPILVNTGTVYFIENSNYSLSEFLVIAFEEDVSSYFSE